MPRLNRDGNRTMLLLNTSPNDNQDWIHDLDQDNNLLGAIVPPISTKQGTGTTIAKPVHTFRRPGSSEISDTPEDPPSHVDQTYDSKMKLDGIGNESLSAINHNENRGEMNGHVLSANMPSPGDIAPGSDFPLTLGGFPEEFMEGIIGSDLDFDTYAPGNEMEQDYEAGASSMHDDPGPLGLPSMETPFPVATSEPMLENEATDMRQDGRKSQLEKQAAAPSKAPSKSPRTKSAKSPKTKSKKTATTANKTVKKTAAQDKASKKERGINPEFEKVIRDESNIGHEEEASLHALSSTAPCSPSATPVSRGSTKASLRRSTSATSPTIDQVKAETSQGSKKKTKTASARSLQRTSSAPVRSPTKDFRRKAKSASTPSMHDCLESPLQEFGEGASLNPDKEMAEGYESGANGTKTTIGPGQARKSPKVGDVDGNCVADYPPSHFIPEYVAAGSESDRNDFAHRVRRDYNNGHALHAQHREEIHGVRHPYAVPGSMDGHLPGPNYRYASNPVLSRMPPVPYHHGRSLSKPAHDGVMYPPGHARHSHPHMAGKPMLHPSVGGPRARPRGDYMMDHPMGSVHDPYLNAPIPENMPVIRTGAVSPNGTPAGSPRSDSRSTPYPLRGQAMPSAVVREHGDYMRIAPKPGSAGAMPEAPGSPRKRMGDEILLPEQPSSPLKRSTSMQAAVGSFPGARSASPLSSSVPATSAPMRKVAVNPSGRQVYASSPQAADPLYVGRDASNRSIPMPHNPKGAHTAPDYHNPGHAAPPRPAHGMRTMPPSKMVVPPGQAGPSQGYHPGYGPTVGMYRTGRGSAAPTMQGHYGHPHAYPPGSSPAPMRYEVPPGGALRPSAGSPYGSSGGPYAPPGMGYARWQPADPHRPNEMMVRAPGPGPAPMRRGAYPVPMDGFVDYKDENNALKSQLMQYQKSQRESALKIQNLETQINMMQAESQSNSQGGAVAGGGNPEFEDEAPAIPPKMSKSKRAKSRTNASARSMDDQQEASSSSPSPSVAYSASQQEIMNIPQTQHSSHSLSPDSPRAGRNEHPMNPTLSSSALSSMQ